MKEALPTSNEKPKRRSNKNEYIPNKQSLTEISEENQKLIEQLKNSTQVEEQKKIFNKLEKRIDTLVSSKNIEKIDLGFRLAFMLRFHTQRSKNLELTKNGEDLFRKTEETVLNRFKEKPKLIQKYIDQAKTRSIPLNEKDPEERNADLWATEISDELMSNPQYENSFKLIDKEGEKARIEIQINGETWEIHFLFREAIFDFIQIQNKKKGFKRMLYSSELRKRIQSGALETYFKEISTQSDKERHRLETYDLPKGKDKTLYQYFVPNTYDEAYASSLIAITAQRALLEQSHDISLPPIEFFGENAKEKFLHYTKTAKESGFDTVHMEIISHGNEEGFEAYTTTTTEELSALELYQSLGSIDGIKINISTNACHGAGLTPAYQIAKKHAPKLVDGINVFTQTKPDIVNLSINKTEGIERSATYYQIFMLEALLQDDVSYGEAANYADQRTQTYSSLNPESIIDGEQIR